MYLSGGGMRRLVVTALAAGIITAAIRAMFFTEDCNLLVTGATYLLTFTVVWMCLAILRRIRRTGPDGQKTIRQ